MIDCLASSISSLGIWGYLAIFLVVALECQPVVGWVMPGESLLLVGGFLAQQGVLSLGGLVLAVSAAAVLGDSLGYELGRRLGRGRLLKHGERFGVSPESLDRVDGFLSRHGSKAVFCSHFLHVLRALMPFLAGARRMGYRKFLLFNALGCVVWATVFVSLGYAAGKSWRMAAQWIGKTVGMAGGVILLAAASTWLWRCLVRRRTEVEVP